MFEAADQGLHPAHLPAFAGKIVIIGSTAASLHDIHPTPLAADQSGVDTLATAIDNAVNHRHLDELPRWLHALLAILLCVGLAAWVQYRKLSSLTHISGVLPVGLLSISYLTLNLSPVFIDLQLSAALALLLLALLRYWHQMQRDFWCLPLTQPECAMAIWPLARNKPWNDAAVDRLIDFTQQRLPQCRLVVPQVQLPIFQTMRWPELALYAAIVGPAEELAWAHTHYQTHILKLCDDNGDIVTLSGDNSRRAIAQTALRLWADRASKNSGGTPPCH